MIRELQWNDMNDLIENYYSYYEEVKRDPEFGIIFFHYKPSFESEVEWFSNLYRDTMKGDAFVRVAVEDGKVVGICDIHRIRPDSEVSHNGVLGIAIREGYRNRGIGKALISDALDAARGKLEIVTLSVFTTNKRANSLYRKLGFIDYGMRPKSIKRGNRYFDELYMYILL